MRRLRLKISGNRPRFLSASFEKEWILVKLPNNSRTRPERFELGGDLGWIREDQINRSLYQTLQTMPIGTVSDQIETLDGFYILWLRDKQIGRLSYSEIEIRAQRLSWRYEDPVERDRYQAFLTRLKQESIDCSSIQRRLERVRGVTLESLGPISLESLESSVQAHLLPLSAGQMTDPLVSPTTVSAWIVCERLAPSLTLPERDEIAIQLGNKRINLLQNRYLLRLQRNTFIEIY